MATGKRVYATGQEVLCRLLVIDGHDLGNPVVAMGEGKYAIARDHLDAVDLNLERPMTQEEQAAFDVEQAALDAEKAAEDKARETRQRERKAKRDEMKPASSGGAPIDPAAVANDPPPVDPPPAGSGGA
jgi:hypothetical protein